MADWVAFTLYSYGLCSVMYQWYRPTDYKNITDIKIIEHTVLVI